MPDEHPKLRLTDASARDAKVTQRDEALLRGLLAGDAAALGTLINHYDRLLYPHMRERLLEYCGDYEQQPAMYEAHSEASLQVKYQDLQLRETSELRLPQLCSTADRIGGGVATLEAEPPR